MASLKITIFRGNHNKNVHKLRLNKKKSSPKKESFYTGEET